MSIKTLITCMLMCFILGCTTPEQKPKESTIDSIPNPIAAKINVENLDFNSPLFKKLNEDTLNGKSYIDFSYVFLQTTLIKRHTNIMGLAIDPSNTSYIRRFSYSYKKAGEHQKAMHLLNLSIDEEPVVSRRINNLDYAAWNYLYYYRDYENTIVSVDKMLSLTKNDLGVSCHGEACLLLKGQALYRMNQFEEANAVFSAYQTNEEAQGFNPMDNSLIVFYKARCLAALNQNDEAIAYFSHLIESHPHAEASYQLAKLYFSRKDFSKAEQYLTEAEKALNEGYSFKEPYFERFDKVFSYQIEDLRNKMK